MLIYSFIYVLKEIKLQKKKQLKKFSRVSNSAWKEKISWILSGSQSGS